MTPVFNGSASLRDAAGQLIENTTKSVKRKEQIDDTYMEKLFDDMTALYRLNQNSRMSGSMSGSKADLGKLPTASVILLVTLAVAWICLLGYVTFLVIKRRGHNK